jgi:signal transduction histidine kinase
MADEGHIAFPDAPRAALDRSLYELVQNANAVLETQGRLRALLRADQALVEELDLPLVLRRIVEAAVELAGAEYGALGVLDARRAGLEQFVYVGLSDDRAEQIGHLPEGRGLLGAVIEDAQPLSLKHLASDPRSSGVPAKHPPMDGFLGVPIRVHGEVFGNLYLTNPASGEFTADDEELIVSLAATAGFAINNARLYAETRRRQEWTAASAELVATVLAHDEADPRVLVADRLRELLHLERIELLRPLDGSDEYLSSVINGGDEDPVGAWRTRLGGTLLERVIAAGSAGLYTSTEDPDASPSPTGGAIMIIPLQRQSSPGPVLIARRSDDRGQFTAFELELASDLARQASLALQLAAARANQQCMELLEDRARIARDLHDLVIQQLFGAGLELQSITGVLAEPTLAQRVMSTIDAIDDAISQIRTVIFALSPRDEASPSIRHRLLDIVGECGASLPRTPPVSFSGAVDLFVRGDLADDVCAVAREALTNVVKHSRARNASASLAVADGWVALEVRDDGVGIGASKRRSGLANLRKRAVARGGALDIESGDSGTHLRWSVPVDSATGAAGRMTASQPEWWT